jgi:hypothetical protein
LAGVGFSDSESLDMTETTKNKKRWKNSKKIEKARKRQVPLPK